MEGKDKEVEGTAVTELPIYVQDMEALIRAKLNGSGDVGDRCFSLLGGRVIFGLLFAELPDSFLVALPSTLNSDDGGRTIDGKLLTASPIIRLMKNGVAFMSVPELEHQYYYYRFIRKLQGMLPGFFTSERLEKIEDAISFWETRAERDQDDELLDSGKGPHSKVISYNKKTRH